MRIIQANKYYYPRGGAETYMLRLSEWLQEQGHEVFPFGMKHADNLPTEFEKYFVSEVKTDSERIDMLQKFRTFGRMMYSLEARRKMATLITEREPDLCHIHNIYTQISPSILHTLSDQHVPVVMTVHDHHLISPQYNIWATGCGKDYRDVGILRGTFSKFHKGSMAASLAQVTAYKWHRWLRIYEKHVALFIAPSAYMKRQLVVGGFPSERIRVNPYGIDARHIQPTYHHDGYVLYVGRLSEEKGVDTIIHAAKQLPDIAFKIVGRGPQMEYLHRLALDAPNVEFLGFRDKEELEILYRDACAVLLPSRVHEVFPLVTLEAMAHGTPVIASDVGGVSEVVEDCVSGLLVVPTDLHGWVEAILRVAYDRDFYRQLSYGARYAVDHLFRSDDHERRLLNIYQEATPIHI